MEQVPRLGVFGSFRPRDFLQIEQRIKQPRSTGDTEHTAVAAAKQPSTSSSEPRQIQQTSSKQEAPRGAAQVSSRRGLHVTQGAACRIESEDAVADARSNTGASKAASSKSSSKRQVAQHGGAKGLDVGRVLEGEGREDGYDSDGVKMVWTSGERAQSREAGLFMCIRPELMLNGKCHRCKGKAVSSFFPDQTDQPMRSLLTRVLHGQKNILHATGINCN